MIRVNNQQIVATVAKKTYHANRKRNILTIFAIILTTFLIVSVLGIGIGYWKMISERQIKMNGMDYDIELTEPTDEQVEIARSLDSIKYAGVCVKCAILDSANNKKLSKVQLYWTDSICWEKQCLPAFDSMVGEKPKNKKDIVLSKEALRDMGIRKPEIGMEIALTYTPLAENEKTQASKTQNQNSNKTGLLKETFILSGYYTDFTGNARGFVSDAFYETTGAKQTDFTQGTLKMTLENPLYSKQTILSLQNKLHLSNNQIINADDDSILNFVRTVFVLVGLLIMIFVSGYLFIYNTLYISISKDIRYYGQLKTIGMTSVQLRKVVYKQAFWNSCIGIPVGLFVGYLVSVKLIPSVLKIQNPELAKTVTFSYYPFLFFIATVFSVLTIFISSRKPAKIAGDCSPIEAIRFTEEKGRGKKSENGIKSMAWRNMFRDRKKAVIVLSSFIVSIVIFFTINVIIRENDSRSILNETYSYDLQIVNELFLEREKEAIGENVSKNDSKEMESQSISETDMREVKKISGVKDTRVIYSKAIDVPYQEEVFGNFYKELYESRYAPGNYEEDIVKYKNGNDKNGFFKSKIIGIDKNELKILMDNEDIQIDSEKFEKGEIALVCGWLSVYPTDAVGKTLSFSLSETENAQEQKILIAGIVNDPSYFSSGYTPSIIVSEDMFRKLIPNPMIELVYIDYVKSLDKKTEKQVKTIFQSSKEVSFDSKLDLYEDMLVNEKQIRIFGNGVGVIIAILSILNYINMMVASVENRKREFAILESIGMTRRQIRKTLIQEGAGYAIISIILSVMTGIPVSYIVFSSMNIYGICFLIPIWSNIILFMSIILVCVIVPAAVYDISCQGNVLERMRVNSE